MHKVILITGGMGLVGTRLTELLIEKGYQINHISRKCSKQKNIACFQWNLAKNYWEKGAIKNVDYIIHLAGANIAEGRWTKKRKQEIVDSRIMSNQLVCQMVEASNGGVKGIISSSAIGYYGINNTNSPIGENEKSGNDFLANVCVAWEKGIVNCHADVSILRTGIVLSKNGGALRKILQLSQWYIAAPLGLGSQLMPWIHIDDLCAIYIYMLENKIKGIYNAVSPQAVTNKEFFYQLAQANKRKIILPNVPAVILKLVVGEMADILLNGKNISSKKIENIGFSYKFPVLSDALKQILKPN